MERSLELTGDGSHTISVPSMHTAYHSRFGAVQESMHVFIAAGLDRFDPGGRLPVDILEIGFGTGLNALLTLIATEERQVRYEAVEAFPLEERIATALNYCEVIGRPDCGKLFNKLHSAPWNEPVEIRPGFMMTKHLTLLQQFRPAGKFDLIYFDAFDPGVQPELWTEDIFRSLASGMEAGGILVTYSSRGQVRRALAAAGFAVEKLPGPPGKREILRAVRV